MQIRYRAERAGKEAWRTPPVVTHCDDPLAASALLKGQPCDYPSGGQGLRSGSCSPDRDGCCAVGEQPSGQADTTSILARSSLEGNPPPYQVSYSRLYERGKQGVQTATTLWLADEPAFAPGGLKDQRLTPIRMSPQRQQLPRKRLLEKAGPLGHRIKRVSEFARAVSRERRRE